MALTLRANDSIACVFTFVRWNAFEGYRWYAWKEGLTSQCSRMKQRPPATDLSGPKASAESLTPRKNNPAAADAVDFQSCLFLSPAPGSLLLEEGSSWTESVITQATTFTEETVRGGRTGRVLFAHRRVSRYRSTGWTLVDHQPGRHSCLRPRSPFDWVHSSPRPRSQGVGGGSGQLHFLRYHALSWARLLACDRLPQAYVSSF